MAVEKSDDKGSKTSRPPKDGSTEDLPLSDPGAFAKRFPRGTPFTRLMDRQAAQRRAASRDTEPPRR